MTPDAAIVVSFREAGTPLSGELARLPALKLLVDDEVNVVVEVTLAKLASSLSRSFKYPRSALPSLH